MAGAPERSPTLTIQAMAWRTADNIIASGQT
jgi:hypothetical protein